MDCEARLIRRVITDNGITVVCGGKKLAQPYMDATLSDLATSMSMPMAGERSDHVSMWRQLKSMGAAFTANDVPVRARIFSAAASSVTTCEPENRSSRPSSFSIWSTSITESRSFDEADRLVTRIDPLLLFGKN